MKNFILILMLFTAACAQPKQTKTAEEPVFQKPTVEPPPLPAPPRPGFITPQQRVFSMNIDAQGFDEDDRVRLRYADACNLANQGADMDLVEQAINKGINSLSTERFLTKVVPVPGAPCAFRMNLDDYAISNAEWRKIEVNLVLQFQPDTIADQQLQFLTQTAKPYIFAQDLFLTAFEGDALTAKKCDVYCDIIDESLDLATFFQQQGINLQQEVNEKRVIFGGFSSSQIALGKTRMVQIAESNNGVCMSTYDVSLAQQDSVFDNPFTIELAAFKGAVRTDKIYKHAAQEHICTANNNMFTWRLNGAATGVAEVVAPTDIVSSNQPEGARIDPAIRIGDCAGCHHAEIAISFSDQVDFAAQKTTGFSPVEKQLSSDFFRNDKLQASIVQINRGHQAALRELGITATEDPLNKALLRTMRTEQSADAVAGWAGLTTVELLDRLRGAPESSKTLSNILNPNGTVSLGTLKNAFPTLIDELNLYKDEF